MAILRFLRFRAASAILSFFSFACLCLCEISVPNNVAIAPPTRYLFGKLNLKGFLVLPAVPVLFQPVFPVSEAPIDESFARRFAAILAAVSRSLAEAEGSFAKRCAASIFLRISSAENDAADFSSS